MERPVAHDLSALVPYRRSRQRRDVTFKTSSHKTTGHNRIHTHTPIDSDQWANQTNGGAVWQQLMTSTTLATLRVGGCGGVTRLIGAGIADVSTLSNTKFSLSFTKYKNRNLEQCSCCSTPGLLPCQRTVTNKRYVTLTSHRRRATCCSRQLPTSIPTCQRSASAVVAVLTYEIWGY